MSEIATATIHPDYANILVACPVPGQENQEPMTLGDFAETERGQKYAQGIVDTSELLEKAGLSKEAAITKALGGAAITNEGGELMRKPAEEQAAKPSQSRETKKK